MLVVTGETGSDKSFLIDSLRQLLGYSFIFWSCFGTPDFNIQGQNFQRVLELPVRVKKCKELRADILNHQQISLTCKKCDYWYVSC